MESDENPGVIEDLFLSIDAAVNHHFVVTNRVGNMSLTRWRLVSESLKLSPCLFFYVELVDVPEGVLLPNRGSTEHNQTVMHLN